MAMAHCEKVLEVSNLNEEKAEQFASEILDAMNSAAVVNMISLGHRTGLFDVMNQAGTLTCPEIATRAGLSERYVREWLAVMVTGRVVIYDPAKKLYELPAEHAACLTRANSPNNLAVTAQMIPMFGGVETALITCFEKGGGLPYSQYERFHEVMAEDSTQTVVSALLDDILPLADGLKESLQEGIRVADIGCGRGRALLMLARHFPRSQFSGFDICSEPLENATKEAELQGLSNVEFVLGDAAALGTDDLFDLVLAFDAIHDQRDPQGVLDAVYDHLVPGGRFLMQDIDGSSHLENNMDHPIAPLIYTISTTHCTCVSLGQGGDGLGTMWGRELAEEMLGKAGFEDVDARKLEHDIFNVFFVANKK